MVLDSCRYVWEGHSNLDGYLKNYLEGKAVRRFPPLPHPQAVMNLRACCAGIRASKRGRGRSFAAIAHCYRELHGASRIIATAPYRLTARGAWATSRAPHVFSFFKQMALDRYELFVDLGSGDGIVACIAGLFTRSIGIEIDRELCELAQRATRKVGLTEQVGFICGDYLTLQIRRADCLYHYPDKPMDDLELLLTGWQGDLLVYGPHFPFRTMTAVRKLACGRERMVLYRNDPEEKELCVKPMHIY